MDQSSCSSHVDDDNDNHGWTKVESRKRNRKQKPADVSVPGNIVPNERRILPAKMVSADVEDEPNDDEGYDLDYLQRVLKPKMVSADVEDEPNNSLAARIENLMAKMVSAYVKKKNIESLSEAMAKIVHSRLAAFLDVSLPEDQVMRFMDYIGRQLTEVRFPWLKTFPFEGTWPKLKDVINVPLCDFPEPIYKTSVDWINQVPIVIMTGFVMWAFKRTIFHLEVQQDGAKSGKIGEQSTSPKPHVAMFVTLAMAARSRPDAFTLALPYIRERPIYQGQDKLPLTVWLMAQTSQGDLSLGLFSLARNLLPVVGNTNCNPQSSDLILQLVENFHKRILSEPKAWTTLMNRAVSEGERLIPPPSFEILLRLTFPASSARVEVISYIGI